MKRLERAVAMSTALSLLWIVQARADTSEARAPTQDVVADVRCMMVGFSLGQTHDASTQTAGLMAAYYYLGRLDGRSPKPDLETLVAQQADLMTPAVVKSEAVRCGGELTETGKRLQVVGQHLVQRGEKQQLEKQQEKQ
jgi:hypothetical protein